MQGLPSGTSSNRTIRRRHPRISRGILGQLLPPPTTTAMVPESLSLRIRLVSAFLRSNASASTPTTSRALLPFRRPTRTCTASNRTSPARATPHHSLRPISLPSTKVRRPFCNIRGEANDSRCQATAIPVSSA